MTEAIYIQANTNQWIAARVAQFAIETRGRARERGIPVTLMNVSQMPWFKAFAGVPFRRGSRMTTSDPDDVQSFTLSRFMPPELMGYAGRALVIDPDVFALADVGDLFATDLKGNAIAACPRPDGWESSVMLLDCARLHHWRITHILAGLKNLTLDYSELIRLRAESQVVELSPKWNSLDEIGSQPAMLHTTRNLTQPWKTGLPIDFRVPKPPPLFGLIPREPLRRLLRKPVGIYLPHPRREVEKVFMDLMRESLHAGALTDADIDHAIAHKFVRPDIRRHIA